MNQRDAEPITIDVTIEPEQLQAGTARSLYALSPVTIAVTTLIGALFSGYFAWTAGNKLGWVLGAAFVVIGGARFMLFSGYRAHQDLDSEAGRWISASLVAMGLTGVCWGALVLLFFDVQMPGSAIAVASVVVAVVMVHLLLLGASLPVTLALAIPALLPLLYKLATSGQSGLVATALVLLAAALGGLFSARGRGQLREVLGLRHADAVLRKRLDNASRDNEQLTGERGELTAARDALQGQLADAKRDAQAAAMAKDEFLATMSHEIRTPLNGIMPLLDLLRGTKLDEAQRDYLNTAFISSRHLLSIIDDILDFSKVEAGKLELEVVGMNLRELLDSVAKMMSGSASRKGLELRSSIDPSVRLSMRGDPVRLRQILTNLVSNAIKFTERGHIEIGVDKQAETRSETELRFSVKDTGIGMDEEARLRLFKPFSQAQSSTTRNYGGTGLGLAICKRLVEMMDGEIGVESMPGRGSTFSFTARLKKSVGDIDTAASRLDRKRLLLVSVSAPFGKRLNAFSNRWGSKLDQAANVKAAVEKIKAAHQKGPGWAFDVLLIDVKTTGGQGLALAKKISETEQLKAVCLLLTEDGEVPAPAKTIAGLKAVKLDSPETVLHSRLEGLFAFTGPTEVAPKQAEYQASTSADALKAKVLLVEDNPINLHVAQKLLDAIGLEFDVAHNGKQGFEKMGSGQFDAVLMDCMMPVMDGYTATRRWRNHEEETGAEARLPIIAMTANAMAGDRQRCLDSGMDDYMSKPLNRNLVVETLRRWIGAADDTTADADTAPTPRPAPAPDTTTTLDQDTLKDLSEVMGDELGDLIQVYLKDSPERVEGIRQAAAAREIKPMIELAHTLKSTSANLGAAQLTEICRQIEEAAKADEIKEAVAAAAPLGGAYDKVADALQEYATTLA